MNLEFPEFQIAGDIELNSIKFPINKHGYVIVFVECNENLTNNSVFFDFCHKL